MRLPVHSRHLTRQTCASGTWKPCIAPLMVFRPVSLWDGESRLQSLPMAVCGSKDPCTVLRGPGAGNRVRLPDTPFFAKQDCIAAPAGGQSHVWRVKTRSCAGLFEPLISLSGPISRHLGRSCEREGERGGARVGKLK